MSVSKVSVKIQRYPSSQRRSITLMTASIQLCRPVWKNFPKIGIPVIFHNLHIQLLNRCDGRCPCLGLCFPCRPRRSRHPKAHLNGSYDTMQR
ncbi:hypothetical protein GYMLUDRAFT_968587 [Collybiopsis luxurians FD-317 M1]|uniref:Unplaced genomic scaffold GYMLUscaffold_96, whole genome shotgun sequence n=1 Tax=Collybiopsis luxurians FD-317 M1 TaxID=944289 RepID=A0A0D0BRT0_9AGAR|nr:hypothetical protein GYMLUDRAFT_968587 [Collybiopsis luxurians FD-317 M1]